MSAQPSAAALALVGESITYESDRRGTIEGTVTAAERVWSTIVDGEGRTWPVVRFRIKPADGSRAFWTHGLPDKATP